LYGTSEIVTARNGPLFTDFRGNIDEQRAELRKMIEAITKANPEFIWVPIDQRCQVYNDGRWALETMRYPPLERMKGTGGGYWYLYLICMSDKGWEFLNERYPFTDEPSMALFTEAIRDRYGL
jgi:hypothetical protein